MGPLSFFGRRIRAAGEVAAVAVLALACAAALNPAAAQQPVQVAQASDSDRLAGAMAELDQLQEELRQLRGRIEELEHARATDEARIGALETQLASQPAAAAAAPSATSGSAPAPAQQMPARLSASPGATIAPSARNGSPSPDPNARTGNVLGTVPRAALLNLPSPGSQEAAAPPPPAAGGTEQQSYDAAMGMLQSANWDRAQQAFEGFLGRYPKSSLAPNAAYWLGETYYVRKDYANAAATFARNYRTYGPDAPKSAGRSLEARHVARGPGRQAEGLRDL